MHFLPKHKFGAIVLGITTMGVVAFIVLSTSTGKYVSTEGTVATALKETPPASADTDNDGLPDWLEELLGTNPANPDTDGDGVTDKEEAPATLKESQPEELQGDTEALSATDQLARNLFNSYISDRRSGPLSAREQESLVRSLVSAPYGDGTPRMSASDITLSSKDDNGALRTYGDALGAIIERNSVVSVQEGIILRDALEREDPESLRQLEPLVAAYRSMAAEALSLQVPPSALSAHLLFVNGFAGMAYTIEKMRGAYEDPLGALLAVKNYLPTATVLLNAFTEAEALFKGRGISFAENEDGKILTTMLSKINGRTSL